jgi:DNA adenine methylase
MKALDPPLKWAGGKRWLVPRLRELYQPFRDRRLVEPFMGGLAVALGLMPEKVLLGDVNPNLVNFYSCLQKGLVVEADFQNERGYFLEARRRFNALLSENRGDTPEAAALFYYLNRTCFNGLCRFNNRGEYNVPFGSYKTINYMKDFSDYAAAFAGWEFVCGDFENVVLAPDDFIYTDPPYDVEFTKYAKDDFTWRDQERLALWLSRHPGPVVASNQATPRILDLYKDLGFCIETAKAPWMIACNGDRTPALEMLATKNI